MKMDKSISTRNNIVIESIRNYVAFLISLRGLLLSFIEEKDNAFYLVINDKVLDLKALIPPETK